MSLKLEINLQALLKDTYPDRRQRRVLTPIVQSPSVIREFGKRVVDRIVERTNKGIDKSGGRFRAYSKSYQKTLVWKVYGKTPNPVNLKLTGAMHAGMKVTDTSNSTVTIGFPDDTLNKRAEFHVTKGVPSKRGLLFRDFFGLPASDQQTILKEVIRDFGQKTADIEAASPIEGITSLALDQIGFNIAQSTGVTSAKK